MIKIMSPVVLRGPSTGSLAEQYLSRSFQLSGYAREPSNRSFPCIMYGWDNQGIVLNYMLARNHRSYYGKVVVCMCACLYVWYVCMYACLSVCLSVCVCLSVSVCLCLSLSVCLSVCVSITYDCTYVSMYLRMHEQGCEGVV